MDAFSDTSQFLKNLKLTSLFRGFNVSKGTLYPYDNDLCNNLLINCPGCKTISTGVLQAWPLNGAHSVP